MNDLHALEVHFQFIGGNLGQTGKGALTHLHFRRMQDDLVVGGYLEP